MKKRFFMGLLSIIVWGTSLSGILFNCQAASEELVSVVNAKDEIQPRAEICEWRYKVINGRLYRRLYNYTRGKWVGDWIEVK